MVVPTDFPNSKSLRSAVNELPDQAIAMVFAHYAVGILQQQALALQPPWHAPSMSPTGDNKNESTIRFGSVPYPLPDALGNEELGTTEEKETTLGTPGSVIQTVETRAEASDVKKLKDKDNNKLKDKDNSKMWRGRRLADKAVYNEIKKRSAALGREPCPRGTNHFMLADILAGLKKETARTPQAAGSQTRSLLTRALSRRHRGLEPENEGLPNWRTKKKPASANETVEKTTGNGPTHNGNRTASDNNRHSHKNETVVPYAPGAPLTFRDQNTGKRSSGAIAAKNSAEDTSSPRKQADDHIVCPNNMITLN